jgi:hypothetical protein
MIRHLLVFAITSFASSSPAETSLRGSTPSVDFASAEATSTAALAAEAYAAAQKEICVPADQECNPTANHCCQGPGLMTCRLRENALSGTAESYSCGPEFPQQLLADPGCVVEGRVCDPGSLATSSCCNSDSDAAPLSCLPALKSLPKTISAGVTLGTHVCRAKAPKPEPSAEACTSEGHGCNPDANSCCQPDATSATLKGSLRPMTCQLLALSVQAWPNSHGSAYICAQDQPSLVLP